MWSVLAFTSITPAAGEHAHRYCGKVIELSSQHEFDLRRPSMTAHHMTVHTSHDCIAHNCKGYILNDQAGARKPSGHCTVATAIGLADGSVAPKSDWNRSKIMATTVKRMKPKRSGHCCDSNQDWRRTGSSAEAVLSFGNGQHDYTSHEANYAQSDQADRTGSSGEAVLSFGNGQRRLPRCSYGIQGGCRRCGSTPRHHRSYTPIKPMGCFLLVGRSVNL